MVAGQTACRAKLLKWLAWAAIALWTGFTFAGYFTPIRDLGASVIGHGAALGFWQWFWMLFYSFFTMMQAGFMREQVCKYMCPYARFQSAMFDRDTLIVSYRHRPWPTHAANGPSTRTTRLRARVTASTAASA